MTRKEQLFQDIGIADFVLTDLGEYLDTHPSDQTALEYFNHYAAIKTQMTKDFAKEFFPFEERCIQQHKRMEMGQCASSLGRRMLSYVEL